MNTIGFNAISTRLALRGTHLVSPKVLSPLLARSTSTVNKGMGIVAPTLRNLPVRLQSCVRRDISSASVGHYSSKSQYGGGNGLYIMGMMCFAGPLSLWCYNKAATREQYGNMLYNDTVRDVADTAVEAIPSQEVREKVSARERRKRYYRQMCLGSILGVVSGLAMIKISGLLVYVTVFCLLSLEWLRHRGFIDIRGKQLIEFSTNQSKSLLNRIEIKQLDFFKLSFLSTLILTYINA